MSDEQPDKGSLSGKDVELRKARQSAYKARQREVAVQLGRLWRLRRSRERGGLPGLPFVPGWDELLVLVRQLVHEEELIARACGRMDASPGEVAAAAAGQGLSTDHISTPEEVGEGTAVPIRRPTPRRSSPTKKAASNTTPRRKKKNGA